MRTAYFNGNFYLERDQFAEAVLVENDQIVSVGTTVDILAQPNLDERVDLEGNTVIPGLNDSHMHLMSVGKALEQLSLADCTSVEEIIQTSREYLAAHPFAQQKGLFGRAWNQDFFSGERRIPNRHDLDRIATDIPVILERVCGHSLVTNTRAIEMLGLQAGSPQYRGGTFELEADGTPNGVFTEDACKYPLALIPEATLEENRALFIRAMEYAVSKGVTSVQSNDIGSFMRYINGFTEMIEDIFGGGSAPLRYRLQTCFQTPANFRASCESGLYSRREQIDSDWIAVGPLKLFKDGSLGARTAMVRAPYQDDPDNLNNLGVETTDNTTMDEYCTIANQYGVQVMTHVIGDRAVGEVLDNYERIQHDGQNPNRNVLNHCQLSTREDLERIVRMGVLVQYQPIFLDYDHMICESRVGRELSSTSYAFRTLQELGGQISYGSDSPVEDCNPFPGIYCAVTRRPLRDDGMGVFFPEERVDVYSAVDAYTIGSAYNEFMEDRKGRIAPGFLADMVVLDRNIFSIPDDEIKEIEPVRTIVGGRTVYQREI